jgi:hypothetical protein
VFEFRILTIIEETPNGVVFFTVLEGSRRMRKSVYIVSLIVVIIIPTFISAQGIYRAYGIGFRTGIWKYSDEGNTRYQPGTVMQSSGGGMLYFFARLVDRWYLEGSIGGASRNVITAGTVENISMVPFLMGARFDLLSRNLGSIFQPYLALGGGMYTITRNIVAASVVNESDAELGIFLGGGVNVVLASWFALNADIKYHLINQTSSYKSDLSGVQMGFGLSFMFGGMPELLRIEDINVIVEDIYPAYYEFYATYPILQVSVRNMVSYPIEVNLHSNIEGYSERSQESGFIQIPAGETEKIPVYAIFGQKLLYAKQREPAIVDLSLEARAGASHIESMSVNVMIHSRNAWNGEVNRLSFFLTPDDEGIMKLSRGIVGQFNDETNTNSLRLKQAREIFNNLTQAGIRYQSDPNIPYYQDDYVQYASETMEKKSGDCDDLVILYCSLLESIGIQTTFVDVQDPEKDIAHLYMMFDSGLSPIEGAAISMNEKKYVIRERSSGKKSIWIPVETTLMQEGFEEAWNNGATTYIEEGVFRSGIAEGWMKIVDVK